MYITFIHKNKHAFIHTLIKCVSVSVYVCPCECVCDCICMCAYVYVCARVHARKCKNAGANTTK